MSIELPASLEQAFRVAAGELGMCSAAWLFVDEVAKAHGDDGLHALRDALGRTYPVLDAVLAARADGHHTPAIEVARVAGICGKAERIVIVGVEARFLDALVVALPSARFALLAHSVFSPDWQRVADNFAGRVELVTLGDFQRHAGARSVLMTFVYGVDDAHTYVMPAWVRASGEDVRTQFRALVGWDVLDRRSYVYPRWLVEVPRASFTHIVTRSGSR